MNLEDIKIGDTLWWPVKAYRRKGQGPLIREVKVLAINPKSIKVLTDTGIFYPHWTTLQDSPLPETDL